MRIIRILPLALLLTLAASAQKTVRYTPSTAECMDFLYRNMSRPDSVDYPLSYWKEQVRLAIRARREMQWGDSVPQWEFLHFVLPVRVNNESLDNARQVIYRELVPRPRGLTMQQAALEVN
ncbi:MAG: transglutaminase domain-containing protein, partial [Bacteroidaceae bacterium]|nr:transglutaminase domain-containing protein [Bacteroidaceae bacterium]